MKRRVRLTEARGGGFGGDRPLVTLAVRSRYRTYTPIWFCIDSAADLSAIPLRLAEQEKIPFPRTEQARGRSTVLVGAVPRYRGLIHVRLFGEEFDWPCDFLESQVPPGRQGYGVIGR